MATKGQRGASTETTPVRFAEAPPPPSLDNHTWLLQAIMEMQKSVGGLTEAVRALQTEGKETRDKLDSLSHKVYAATAIIVVLGGLASFSHDILDFVISLLHHSK